MACRKASVPRDFCVREHFYSSSHSWPQRPFKPLFKPGDWLCIDLFQLVCFSALQSSREKSVKSWCEGVILIDLFESRLAEMAKQTRGPKALFTLNDYHRQLSDVIGRTVTLREQSSQNDRFQRLPTAEWGCLLVLKYVIFIKSTIHDIFVKIVHR